MEIFGYLRSFFRLTFKYPFLVPLFLLVPKKFIDIFVFYFNVFVIWMGGDEVYDDMVLNHTGIKDILYNVFDHHYDPFYLILESFKKSLSVYDGLIFFAFIVMFLFFMLMKIGISRTYLLKLGNLLKKLRIGASGKRFVKICSLLVLFVACPMYYIYASFEEVYLSFVKSVNAKISKDVTFYSARRLVASMPHKFIDIISNPESYGRGGGFVFLDLENLKKLLKKMRSVYNSDNDNLLRKKLCVFRSKVESEKIKAVIADGTVQVEQLEVGKDELLRFGPSDTFYMSKMKFVFYLLYGSGLDDARYLLRKIRALPSSLKVVFEDSALKKIADDPDDSYLMEVGNLLLSLYIDKAIGNPPDGGLEEKNNHDESLARKRVLSLMSSEKANLAKEYLEVSYQDGKFKLNYVAKRGSFPIGIIDKPKCFSGMWSILVQGGGYLISAYLPSDYTVWSPSGTNMEVPRGSDNLAKKKAARYPQFPYSLLNSAILYPLLGSNSGKIIGGKSYTRVMSIKRLNTLVEMLKSKEKIPQLDEM